MLLPMCANCDGIAVGDWPENEALAAELKATRTITYSVEPGGHFSHVSPADQLLMFRVAFDEFDDICDLKFELTTSTTANLRITFHSIADFLKYAKVNAAGVMWSDGRLWLNGERPIGWSRGAITVCQHEPGHYIRRDKWHSPNADDVMHADGNAKGFSAGDAKMFQARVGEPTKPFWPINRKLVAEEHAGTVITWNQAVAARNAEMDKTKRAQKTILVQSSLQEVIRTHAKFHAINKSWVGVPGAS